jgi:hypothetical protein
MKNIIKLCFNNSGCTYLTVKNGKCYYTNTLELNNHTFDKNTLLQLVIDIIKNSYISLGGLIFLQKCGVSMGSSFSPIICDLICTYYENKFFDNPSNRNKLDYPLIRYADDVLMFNTDLIWYDEIYPQCLIFEPDITENGKEVNFLDLNIKLSNNKLTINLYSKLRHINISKFNDNFCSDNNLKESLISNIIYGQLIRYFKICSTFADFKYNVFLLTKKFKYHGFQPYIFNKSIRKFISIFFYHFSFKYSFKFKHDIIYKMITN